VRNVPITLIAVLVKFQPCDLGTFGVENGAMYCSLLSGSQLDGFFASMDGHDVDLINVMSKEWILGCERMDPHSASYAMLQASWGPSLCRQYGHPRCQSRPFLRKARRGSTSRLLARIGYDNR